MKLFLVRHGIAGRDPRSGDHVLTERGRREVAALGRLLAPRARPTRLYHSGLTRARETAELLAAELAGTLRPKEVPGLTPQDDPADLDEYLGSEDEDVLLVSHLPFLPRLASRLLGSGGARGIRWEPAAALAAERIPGPEGSADGPPPFQLLWFVPATLLGE